jgi:hypothetical protein
MTESTNAPVDNLKINPIKLIVNWQELDAILFTIKNSQAIYYDPVKQEYLLNGVVVTPNFLNEVTSKLSHVINAIANVQLAKKIIINMENIKKD